MSSIGEQITRLVAWITAGIARAAAAGYGGIERHSDIRFDISPHGEQIVFTASGRGRRDIYLLHLRNLTVTALAKTAEYETSPVFSPAGTEIVYSAKTTSTNPSHIFERSISGRQARQLTNAHNAADNIPSFSPDGSRIVYARAHRLCPYSMGGWTWDMWDLYVMNPDGSQAERITYGNYRGISAPKFLPNGHAIVFSAEPPDVSLPSGNIFIVDSKGRQSPKQLTSDGRSSDPAPSPDGRQIVFISDRDTEYDYELYRMNIDGTNPVRITQMKSYNLRPVFIPDGKSVLFLCDPERDVRYALWQVDVDGSHLREIAGPDVFDHPLRWKP